MKSILIASLLSLGALASQASDSSPHFAEQMKALSQEYFHERPMVATIYGVPDSQAGEGIMSSLGHFDPASEAKRRSVIKSILTRLDAIDVNTLTDNQRLTYGLIKTEISGSYLPASTVEYGSILGEYGNWFLPYAVSHLSGPYIEFSTVMEDKFVVTNEDEAKAFLSRLTKYPGMIDGLIEKMNADKDLGVIAPDFIISKTIENLKRLIKPAVKEHPLVTSYASRLAKNNVPRAKSYKLLAITMVEEGYYNANSKLIAALEAIKPLATHQAGVSRLPNGKAFYQSMITHMTDTKRTPEDIHALGLAEVKRITVEMDILLNKTGLTTGTVGERMTAMLNDPKYLYPNTAEGKAKMLDDIRADLALADAQLPKYFGTLPDQDVVVKAVPDHQAAATAGAFYDAPSQDGKRLGTFWISLYDTAANPSYTLQTLTYHEANPGHHLQTILGMADNLPILSTIFYSNAMGEGWGLYAERLASDMGIYKDDPVDDIGRLQAEMHRAVRLVVDTGMHALGWSRERAIKYSMDTEGNHISEATDEVERYVVWPGQALGYKLGELKIVELRERAREALGDAFDIRVFHDRILESGALPLNLLEDKINAWIATSLKN